MWLNQDFFVHALYPEGCTDDLEHRKAPHSGEYLYVCVCVCVLVGPNL